MCAKLNEEADGATRRDGRCFNIRSYSLVIMQVRVVVSLRQTTVVSTKKCKLREACLSTEYAIAEYSARLLTLSHRTCVTSDYRSPNYDSTPPTSGIPLISRNILNDGKASF